MLKYTMTAAALAIALAAPVFAQNPSSGQKAGFLQGQTANEWRGSKLIGASVYGPDNASIGEIGDVLIDDHGKISAVVVGVGSFLGVAQKDVALPFQALTIKRTPGSTTIDKITVSVSKDELNAAPAFAFDGAAAPQTTTGLGGGATAPSR